MSTGTIVYGQLHAAIIEGTFSRGQLLRHEQIARDYGVCKIPVRSDILLAADIGGTFTNIDLTP